MDPLARVLAENQVHHRVTPLLEILVDPLARAQVPSRALLLVQALVQALVMIPVDLRAKPHQAVSTPAVLQVIAQASVSNQVQVQALNRVHLLVSRLQEVQANHQVHCHLIGLV